MTHSHRCPDCGELRFCDERECATAYESFCTSCLDEARHEIALGWEEE